MAKILRVAEIKALIPDAYEQYWPYICQTMDVKRCPSFNSVINDSNSSVLSTELVVLGTSGKTLSEYVSSVPSIANKLIPADKIKHVQWCSVYSGGTQPVPYIGRTNYAYAVITYTGDVSMGLSTSGSFTASLSYIETVTDSAYSRYNNNSQAKRYQLYLNFSTTSNTGETTLGHVYIRPGDVFPSTYIDLTVKQRGSACNDNTIHGTVTFNLRDFSPYSDDQYLQSRFYGNNSSQCGFWWEPCHNVYYRYDGVYYVNYFDPDYSVMLWMNHTDADLSNGNFPCPSSMSGSYCSNNYMKIYICTTKSGVSFNPSNFQHPTGYSCATDMFNIHYIYSPACYSILWGNHYAGSFHIGIPIPGHILDTVWNSSNNYTAWVYICAIPYDIIGNEPSYPDYVNFSTYYENPKYENKWFKIGLGDRNVMTESQCQDIWSHFMY